MRFISTNSHEPGVFAFGQFAVGIVAFGQVSLGVIAVGQVARGVVAVGQAAMGVFTVGQLAVGLWHATGMIGVGGRSGFGLVLHLLPGIQREPSPELPTATTFEALHEGAASGSEGWLACRLSSDGTIVSDRYPIDTSGIASRLREAAAAGYDCAHVKTAARVVPDPSGYREATAHVDLVAENVIVHRSRPRGYIAYPTLFRGQLGEPASVIGIVVRSLLWIAVTCLVVMATVLPLLRALRGSP